MRCRPFSHTYVAFTLYTIQHASVLERILEGVGRDHLQAELQISRENSGIHRLLDAECFSMTRWRVRENPNALVIRNPFEAAVQTPVVQALQQRVEAGELLLRCVDVAPGAQAFFMVLLRKIFPQRPLVLVTAGLKSQESLMQDVETWLAFANASAAKIETASSDTNTSIAQPSPAVRPFFYPAWEVLPHEAKLPHADIISERLETLVALSGATDAQSDATGTAPLIVTTVVALMQRTFAPRRLRESTRPFKRGHCIEPLDLIEWLEEQGYEPEAQVTQKGEIALRGGIVDVFPPTSPWPVRLEFFGDELESIRQFDPTTQISRAEIPEVTIPPAGELGMLKRHAAVDENGSAASAKQDEALGSLLDYLPGKALFVLCEPDALTEQAEQYAEQIPEGDLFFGEWNEFQAQVQRRGGIIIEARGEEASGPITHEQREGTSPLIASAFAETGDDSESDTKTAAGDPHEPPDMSLGLASLDEFRPLLERAAEPQIVEAQRREFFAQLHRWSRQGHEVIVFCNNDGERQRFSEILRDYGFADDTRLVTRLGALTRGFIFTEARLVVVTDAEIFGRYKVQRPRRLKSAHALATRSALDIDFADLEEGDYVVHLQHGIGRYLGMGHLPAAKGRKAATSVNQEVEKISATDAPECLVIEYAASDPAQPAPKLYVPVMEAHLVSKYVGTGKARPPLNTLGSTRWQKAKAQAQEAVRDLAAGLLEIQAARELQPGHAFAPDNSWQREFESSFLYEETVDQMRAIVETKADMETSRPMDRLICGDVGYGKTEVAIRAAFKAVMGGKQVAVLVPTTVLAQQHFNTFRERMSDYPVRVELLSRFRTRREMSGVIRDLAAGTVDIVIGTHRLVQKDVSFKELGLVVIDEEQRFGVMHKERFKELRKLVDVLTLSATPIPRTLYLALSGAREMSTIATPPHDRLPIETIVAQYDERLIRDAIQRELNRQGQVFFLHNRVSTIDAVATRLRALVPHARLVVGHGQMESDELEDVMTRFVNGEADVLLSTTIIESGLDIPNANTIIIDRADRFGLSELYQLRGRVGRYKHQAFAYLLLPRHAGLLTDARKRISAIKQYSSLGSGFKIAMRDLEIRGAGNLLGPQQSGHITAVGFDLYCQLLKQSVAALKGQRVKPRVQTEIRLDFIELSPGHLSRPTTTAPRDLVGETESGSDDSQAKDEIVIPREVATFSSHDVARTPLEVNSEFTARAEAFLPASFISNPRHRIQVYRQVAQISSKQDIVRLQKELRDRFGPIPPAVDCLLQISELKCISSEKGIASVETQGNKLMLTRNGELLLPAGKFPRLASATAAERLNEIKRLVLSL